MDTNKTPKMQGTMEPRMKQMMGQMRPMRPMMQGPNMMDAIKRKLRK